MKKLKVLFDEILGNTLDFNNFPETFHDVIFDITSTESALAGIADQLLSKSTPTVDQLVVLNVTLMRGNLWLLVDGSSFDLTSNEVLYNYGLLLNSLQNECKAVMNSRSSFN